uniref:Putative 5.3 kDa protein n=1 Tax=Ixodes ricinus TaxID=34613 RepID=A0A147BXJ5_IXORI
MAQKLALIMFVVIGLLAIQTLYLVECRRDTGRQTNDPFPCRRLCDPKNPNLCKGPCPKCRGGPWTPFECAQ